MQEDYCRDSFLNRLDTSVEQHFESKDIVFCGVLTLNTSSIKRCQHAQDTARDRMPSPEPRDFPGSARCMHTLVLSTRLNAKERPTCSLFWRHACLPKLG
eukprot:4579508-Amphidinium_carterae.1